MADYRSSYTGEEIDAGIGKAVTATQPADLVNYQSKIDSSHKLSADLISDGDINKTVTEFEKSSWTNKQDHLVSGTTIKSINNTSILDAGNLELSSKKSIDISNNNDDFTSAQIQDVYTNKYDVITIITSQTTSNAYKAIDLAESAGVIGYLSYPPNGGGITAYLFIYDSDQQQYTVQTEVTIPQVDGTNDGTNWTKITIGGNEYSIPTGGTEVSGTNDGTNWTSLTIDGTTKNIPNDYLESIEIVEGGSSQSDVADGELMNWYKGTLNDNGSVITNAQQDGTRYVNLKPIKLHEGDTVSIKQEYANTLVFIPYAYSTNNLSNSSTGQGGSTSWIDCVIGDRNITWGNSFTYNLSTATGYENEGTNISDPAYFRFVVRTADLQNNVVSPTVDDWNNIVNDVFDFSEVTYDADNSAFYPIIISPDTITITDNHGNETSFTVNGDSSRESSQSVARGFVHKELLSSGYICHRGYYDNTTYIENSISALDRGYEAGARLFEVDLRMTSDGIPVLMHDTTVNRTTDGTGTVTNMTLAQIQQLHMKNSSTEGVPTLEDVLEWTKLHDVVLELDMANRELSTSDLTTIYNMVRDKGMLGQVFFTVLLEDANKLQNLDNSIIMCIERMWTNTDVANLANFKTNRLIFAGSEYTYSNLTLSRFIHSFPNAKYRTWLSTTRQSAETEILTKGVDYVITEGFYTLINEN